MVSSQPLTQRRRLALSLRKLREEAGLTTRELADLLGVSQSRVTKVENARVGAKPELVDAWARTTGASADLVAQLVEQARFARSESTPWESDKPGGFVAQQRRVAEREAAATAIRIFQPAFVPGLLQVHDYVRRVVGFTKTPPNEIAAAVAARIQRQAILYDTSKHFEILLAEPALRWLVAPPSVMVAQLRHIESAMTLPNVTIGVVPLESEAVDIYLHGFVLLEGPEDDDAGVLVDLWTSEEWIDDPSDVAAYQDALRLLRTVARYDDEARALLDQIAEGFRSNIET